MLHSLKKMFKSNYLFTFGVIICLFWIIMAIIAPMVAPYDPVVQDLTLRLKAPSAAHIFGTDNFGRDIFSRVIYGGRYSLLAGCLTVVIAGCIGTIYGAISGYVGGAVDNIMTVSYTHLDVYKRQDFKECSQNPVFDNAGLHSTNFWKYFLWEH